MAGEPLRVMIVDDEAPARMRLRDVLGDVQELQPTELAGMAGNGVEALRLLEEVEVDVVFADIRMPVMDGVALARALAERAHAPAVVFTTAYDEYAVQAFELDAVDYLVKPVRAARLVEALGRVRRSREATVPSEEPAAGAVGRRHFSVVERGRVLFVPLDAVLYLRAELKYVTAVTAERSYLLDDSLVQLEEELGERFVRIHRNCLVARAAIAGVERSGGHEGEARWEVLLHQTKERLPVSRRQWAAVRQALQI